jgi:uncharacterized protein (DUF58 family)
MTRFLHWRKMTWAILLWNVAMVVLVVSGGLVLAFLVWTLGLIALSSIWFGSRPLWRVGHGARLRRLRPVKIPFKSTEGLFPSPR